MNIMSVSGFDAAVQQLNSIKGNVTADQLSSLKELFSTNIWNTDDAEETATNIERQIQQIQQLLDDIQKDIDDLYNQQKYENEQMNKLINDLDEESYQASKNQEKNIKEQQDLVEKATDEAFNAYLKGDIEKEEIPSYIAKQVAKGNQPGGAAMQAHLDEMDAKGQKITNLSNKIAGILDSINEYTAKYKTTEASLKLLQKLKTQVPAKKTRNDIETNIARPYFSPSQEALGDKLIDQFKVAGATNEDGAASASLTKALKSSGIAVDEARKAELNAMTDEQKAAAVEEADTSKYSALELMYLSGMDMYQAAYAISQVFSGTAISYNKANGALVLPGGHGAQIAAAHSELLSQYKTLWNGNVDEQGGGDTPTPTPIVWDPIEFRQGDTNFMFAVDRNNDNIFNGAEEFLGAEDGWAEVTAMDDNGDGKLTAEEMTAHGARLVKVNQALKNGGKYGFNGVAESGVESIDLKSYNAISALKNTNLNGNKRVAEFDMQVNGETVLGKQTENTEDYNETFYGHVFGDVYSFGLDEAEVAAALEAAAQPRNYTASEQLENETANKKAQDKVESDKETTKENDATLANINANATIIGAVPNKTENENKEENQDSANSPEASTPSTNAEENQKVKKEEV